MDNNFMKLAQAVIETQAKAIAELGRRVDDSFSKACELLLNTSGRVIVMGMGKSGHIANKIAATMASTGTPALFVHPAEAAHGDFGMITAKDSIIALSNSGETSELLTLLPFIKRYNIPLISVVGNCQSTLALASSVVIDAHVEQEACPLGLAPTTSTTAALVLGDALAIALLDARGFTADDFALSHPGGKLGKKLLLKIDDLYQSGEALPVIADSATISEALIEVTNKKLGMTCVIDKQGKLSGVFTDGDVRRSLQSAYDIQTTPIKQVMTKDCHTILKGMLAHEALQIMEKKRITSLVVVCDDAPVGVVHLHHLIQAGVV